MPRLKSRAEEVWPHTRPRWRHPNAFVDFFWFSRFVRPEGWEQLQLPYRRYLKTWILWTYGQAFAWLILALVTAMLATSIGLVNRTNFPYWIYYLLYARANGALNGAHIDSYLSVCVLGLYAAYLTRDFWFGVSMTGFGYAVHEGIWTVAYYLAWGSYLSWSMLINVATDLVSVGALLLVFFAFWKYPLRKPPARAFLWPVVAFIGFLAVWFVVPHLFGYPWLPITTINNPNVGVGLYQMTAWYWDWLPNFLESASWILLSVGLGVALWWWSRTSSH